MNRRTAIVSVTAVAVLAAGAAVALGVPATTTAVPVEAAAVEIDGSAQTFHGTSVVLPEDFAAFTLAEDGTLASVGDTSRIDDATLVAITAQLQAAPPQSVLYVDLGSLNSDGLTTALATVTPTNGHTIGTTNEEVGHFLVGIFPDQAASVTSLDIANVPNASVTTSQSADGITWQVTEYLFQFGDATVSVHLSTTDTTGETRADFDQFLATMTR